MNRSGLQHALNLLKAGKADGLLIVKLDRLTRSIADWQNLIDAFFGERGGKQLLSVNDSIDTRTAAGRLVLNVLITVAHLQATAVHGKTGPDYRFYGALRVIGRSVLLLLILAVVPDAAR